MIRLVRDPERQQKTTTLSIRDSALTEFNGFICDSPAEDQLLFECRTRCSSGGGGDPRADFETRYGFDPFLSAPNAIGYLSNIYNVLLSMDDEAAGSPADLALTKHDFIDDMRNELTDLCGYIDPQDPRAFSPNGLPVLRCRWKNLDEKASLAWTNFQAHLSDSIASLDPDIADEEFYYQTVVGIVSGAVSFGLGLLPGPLGIVGSVVVDFGADIVLDIVGFDTWLQNKVREWHGVPDVVQKIIHDVTNHPEIQNAIRNKICELIGTATSQLLDDFHEGNPNCEIYMAFLIDKWRNSSNDNLCSLQIKNDIEDLSDFYETDCE